MNTLAIDPGTSCGWAHSCGAGGTWDLSVRKDESSGMRLIRLRGKLSEVLRDAGIDLLVYEAARAASQRAQGRALVVAGEIQGTLKSWCIDVGIESAGYSSTQIKRFATGNGNAGKPAMRAAAEERWGEAVVACMSEDAIDAKWLLEMVQTELEGVV